MHSHGRLSEALLGGGGYAGERVQAGTLQSIKC